MNEYMSVPLFLCIFSLLAVAFNKLTWIIQKPKPSYLICNCAIDIAIDVNMYIYMYIPNYHSLTHHYT